MDMRDSAILTFFLLALVAILKLRVQIRSYSVESYRNIAGGLSILALAAIARVFHGMGAFESVPFLSEAFFYDLALMITAITGAAMLVTGVASWLPIARKHFRYGETRLRRLELLRHVEQLVGVENRLNFVLERTLSYMVSHFQLIGGAVFKYSARQNQLVLVETTDGLEITREELEALHIDINNLALWSSGDQVDTVRLLAARPTSMPRPWRVLPIMVGKRAAGFFMLWADPEQKFTTEDDLSLRLSINIIVRKIEQDRVLLKQQSLEGIETLRNKWLTACSGENAAKDAFANIIKAVSELAQVDYAAFSMLGSDGRIARRYSSGSDTRVLVETNLDRPLEGSLTGATFSYGIPTVISWVGPHSRPAPNEIVTGPEVRSVMALAVPSEDSVQAVMILASQKHSAFSSTAVAQLRTCMPVLSAFITLDRAEALQSATSRRLNRLSELAASVGAKDFATLSAEVVQGISTGLNATCVRVSTIEDGGAFLRSRALAAGRDCDGLVPANGNLITSLMPIHEELLQMGRPIVHVPEKVESNGRIEMRQMFGFQPTLVLLVPMIVEDHPQGVISVAFSELQPKQQVDQAQDYISVAANVLAVAMKLGDRQTMQTGRRYVLEILQKEKEHRNRLKSWVTGVLGSVELIQARHEHVGDDQVKHYLDILNTSARKIDSYLKEEETVGV